MLSDQWREIRCPRCHKLLCKVNGIAEIEISCKRCQAMILWPDLSISIISPIDNQNKKSEDLSKGYNKNEHTDLVVTSAEFQ